MVHRASTERSSSERSSDERPTIITRLDDEDGWSICGGVDTCGSANAWVSRSLTTWRACESEVPGSKTSSMLDSPATESEWMVSRNATPASRSCSSGTVISCSTSGAESPSASVWTSTVGGRNSGNVSRGMSRSCTIPNAVTTMASAITIPRERRLAPTIQPIMSAGLLSRWRDRHCDHHRNRGPGRLRARTIACARSATWSLLKMFETWLRTVLWLMPSRPAITGFACPCAISSRT